MTGFGRTVANVAGHALQVEIRTLNHRHADVQIRLPRALSALEHELRNEAKAVFARGKIDVTVALGSDAPGRASLEIDHDAVAEYVSAARAFAEAHGTTEALTAGQLLSLPGVSRLVDETLPEDELAEALRDTFREAAAAAGEMRQSEGAGLERELRAQLARVSETCAALERRANDVSELVRERLRKRAEALRDETGILDEARLHQEVVLAADRMDIREELVRMGSHVDQFLATLSGDEPVGRRLEFLLQEMGREANTVGSKAGDAPLAHLVVDLKTELERIREQVQNVE
jgi:uncharacterized protein (TIGR00255 family)